MKERGDHEALLSVEKRSERRERKRKANPPCWFSFFFFFFNKDEFREELESQCARGCWVCERIGRLPAMPSAEESQPRG